MEDILFNHVAIQMAEFWMTCSLLMDDDEALMNQVGAALVRKGRTRAR